MSNLHEKLTAIQAKLKVAKSQYNSFGKYAYRNCEDILEALKPLLVEHGLCLSLSDTIEMIGTRYYVRATATIREGKEELSVSAHAREEDMQKGMSGAQLTGSCSSYARKYALNALFLIDDTKDDDTHNQEAKTKTVTQAPQNSQTVNDAKEIFKPQQDTNVWKAKPIEKPNITLIFETLTRAATIDALETIYTTATNKYKWSDQEYLDITECRDNVKNRL